MGEFEKVVETLAFWFVFPQHFSIFQNFIRSRKFLLHDSWRGRSMVCNWCKLHALGEVIQWQHSKLFRMKIYLAFISWRWKLWSWCFSVLLLNELIESLWKLNSFIVLLMHALNLNSCTCFFNNPNWSFKPSCSQKCVLHRPWNALKVLKLSSKLKHKRNQHSSFYHGN